MTNSYSLAPVFSLLIIIGINNANCFNIILKLIHRNSISPLYTTSALQSKSDDDIRGPLVPDRYGQMFLVNVSIGEDPLFPQLLAMDTGSSFPWIASHSIYRPEDSASYTSISCNSGLKCISYFPTSKCDKESICRYEISYVGGAHSEGHMALETFTFMTSTGGISQVPNLLFGNEIYGSEGDDFGGILGLGYMNNHSLVSRVGRRFSYCIGNISDPHYTYNALILGDRAISQGDPAPMEISFDGHYLVSLEGMSVGNKQIKINSEELKFNVVIDTGATFTYLPRSVFEQIKTEVMELLDGVVDPIVKSSAGERPCYRGDLVRDLKGFPTVTFYLTQTTSLSLDIEAMFQTEGDGTFCLAVDVHDKYYIIGIMAQQYYNVGFDLDAKRVTFQRIACELLQDY